MQRRRKIVFAIEMKKISKKILGKFLRFKASPSIHLLLLPNFPPILILFNSFRDIHSHFMQSLNVNFMFFKC